MVNCWFIPIFRQKTEEKRGIEIHCYWQDNNTAAWATHTTGSSIFNIKLQQFTERAKEPSPNATKLPMEKYWNIWMWRKLHLRIMYNCTLLLMFLDPQVPATVRVYFVPVARINQPNAMSNGIMFLFFCAQRNIIIQPIYWAECRSPFDRTQHAPKLKQNFRWEEKGDTEMSTRAKLMSPSGAHTICYPALPFSGRSISIGRRNAVNEQPQFRIFVSVPFMYLSRSLLRCATHFNFNLFFVKLQFPS